MKPPVCISCDKKLKEPGGILLSPPTDNDWEELIVHNIEKSHLCVKCFPKVRQAVESGQFKK